MKYVVESKGKHVEFGEVVSQVVVEAETEKEAVNKAMKMNPTHFFRDDKVWSKEWLTTNLAIKLFSPHIEKLLED